MIEPPPIVSDDLLDRTRLHVLAALGDDPGSASVPGDGLVSGFARLAQIVADRINGAADKNMLAFLDLVGVRQTSPKAARAPLTFTLAPGAPAGVLISAGSVAASSVPGLAGPVLFETERDLVATPSQLLAVLAVDPIRDRVSDVAQAFADEPGTGADPFTGSIPVRHRLLIGSDDALALGAVQQVEINVATSSGSPYWVEAADWSFWDGSAWQPLPTPAVGGPGQVEFDQVSEVPSATLGGVTTRWLAATLSSPLPAVDVSRSPSTPEAVISAQDPPDAAYDDTVALDTTQPFAPFGASGSSGTFLLRADGPFGKPGAPVSIRIDLDQTKLPAAPAGFALAWEYWSGATWATLSTSAAPDSPTLDPTFLLGGGTVSFTNPHDWARSAGPQTGAAPGYWLRLRIVGPSLYTVVPIIATLTISFEWTLPRATGATISSYVSVAAPGVFPDLALVNGAPVDATRDFLAFGALPAPGDALYVACDEAIDPSRGSVTITVELTSALSATLSPILAWEYWDADTSAWEGLSITDTTSSLKANGTISFAPPSSLGAVSIGGQTYRWLRVRIAGGDYGQPATYTSTDGSFTLTAATLAPPSIASLRFSYTAQRTDRAPELLTVEDWTSSEGTHVVAAQPPLIGPDDAFEIFSPMTASDPMLLLGFREAFVNAGIDLYFEVAPAQGPALNSAAEVSQLVWEYNDGSSWRALGARDETNGLTSSGLVGFVAPTDLARVDVLGLNAVWLRVRRVAGPWTARPPLLAIRTNTTWADQQTSVMSETLGSGSGQPSQEFETTQRPILEGQILEVLEPETPTADELAVLGPGAVRQAEDASGQALGVWVRWTEAGDFVASGPRSRDYVVDRIRGTVTFGDGQHGLVPPIGRGNVQSTYQAGGGASGNVPAGSITQLRTAIPFVAGVMNYEPAGGGSDAEDLELVRERGPRLLRHRDRAVAVDDYGDLALEASTEVARAVAVPAASPPDAGQVGLVIVSGHAAAPDAELLALVRDYVSARMCPTAALWVAGPGWLEVTVTAGLVPLVPELASDVEGIAQSALAAFLDPLSGGSSGSGWPFGRAPYASDLVALLEAIDGLDHVAWLSVDEQFTEAPPAPGTFLVTGGDHTITMLTPGAST